MEPDRHRANWSLNGRANALPFFVYGIFFVSLIYGGTTQFPLFLVRCGIILLGLLVLCKNEIFLPRGLTVPIFLFFLYALIAALTTFFSSAPWPAMQWSLNIALCLLFFVGALQAVRRGAIEVTSFSTLFLFLICLELAVQIVQKVWFNVPRPSGTFYNPNFLAEFYSISACLFLARGIVGDEREGGERLFLIPALLAVSGIIITGSRGGAISFLLGALLIFIVAFRAKGALCALVLALALALTPNQISNRIFKSHDAYSYSRLEIYRGALKIFSDHPAGIGLGNFKYYFPEQNFPVYEGPVHYGKKAKTVHNEHMQVLVELGAPGFSAYVAFLVSILFLLVKRRRKGGGRWIDAGIAGGLLSLASHAFFDSVYHTFSLPLLALILLSLMVERGDHNWQKVKIGSFGRSAAFLLFILLFTIAAGSGAGYYLIRKGQEAARQGDRALSLKMARWSILADPLNGKNVEGTAGLYFHFAGDGENPGDYRLSLRYLERAIHLQKRADWLYERKAFLLAYGLENNMIRGEEEGKAREEMIALYRKVLTLNPYNVTAMRNLALLLLPSENGNESEKVLRKALTIEPNFVSAYTLLGKIYEMRGDHKKSAILYKRALSVYKKYAGVKGLDGYSRSLVTVDKGTLKTLQGKGK